MPPPTLEELREARRGGSTTTTTPSRRVTPRRQAAPTLADIRSTRFRGTVGPTAVPVRRRDDLVAGGGREGGRRGGLGGIWDDIYGLASGAHVGIANMVGGTIRDFAVGPARQLQRLGVPTGGPDYRNYDPVSSTETAREIFYRSPRRTITRFAGPGGPEAAYAKAFEEGNLVSSLVEDIGNLAMIGGAAAAGLRGGSALAARAGQPALAADLARAAVPVRRAALIADRGVGRTVFWPENVARLTGRGLANRMGTTATAGPLGRAYMRGIAPIGRAARIPEAVATLGRAVTPEWGPEATWTQRQAARIKGSGVLRDVYEEMDIAQAEASEGIRNLANAFTPEAEGRRFSRARAETTQAGLDTALDRFGGWHIYKAGVAAPLSLNRVNTALIRAARAGADLELGALITDPLAQRYAQGQKVSQGMIDFARDLAEGRVDPQMMTAAERIWQTQLHQPAQTRFREPVVGRAQPRTAAQQLTAEENISGVGPLTAAREATMRTSADEFARTARAARAAETYLADLIDEANRAPQLRGPATVAGQGPLVSPTGEILARADQPGMPAALRDERTLGLEPRRPLTAEEVITQARQRVRAARTEAELARQRWIDQRLDEMEAGPSNAEVRAAAARLADDLDTAFHGLPATPLWPTARNVRHPITGQTQTIWSDGNLGGVDWDALFPDGSGDRRLRSWRNRRALDADKGNALNRAEGRGSTHAAEEIAAAWNRDGTPAGINARDYGTLDGEWTPDAVMEWYLDALDREAGLKMVRTGQRPGRRGNLANYERSLEEARGVARADYPERLPEEWGAEFDRNVENAWVDEDPTALHTEEEMVAYRAADLGDLEATINAAEVHGDVSRIPGFENWQPPGAAPALVPEQAALEPLPEPATPTTTPLVSPEIAAAQGDVGVSYQAMEAANRRMDENMAALESDALANPARFRAAWLTMQDIREWGDGIVEDVAQRDLAAAVELRDALAEMPTMVRELAEIGWDIEYVPGGRSRGVATRPGKALPGHREGRVDRTRTTAELDLTPRGQTSLRLSELWNHFTNKAAQEMVTQGLAKPVSELFPELAGLRGRELAGEIKTRGYRLFDAADPLRRRPDRQAITKAVDDDIAEGGTAHRDALEPEQQALYDEAAAAEPLVIAPFMDRAFNNYFGRVEHGRVWKAIDAGNRIFKMGVLALSPRWWVGNIVGNAIQLSMGGGVNPLRLPQRLRQGAQFIRDFEAGRENPYLNAQTAQLAYGTARVDPYLLGPTALDQIRQAADEVAPEAALGAAPKPPRMLRRMINRSYRINSFTDNMARVAAYIDLVERNGGIGKLTEEMAAVYVDEALKAVGDFRRMTHFEKDYVRQAIPFYSWLRHISMAAGRLPIQHPARVALVLHLGQLGLPEGYDDRSFLTRGAFPLGGGRFLPLNQFNPYAGAPPLDLADEEINPLTAPLQFAAGASTPIVEFPLELLTGQTLDTTSGLRPLRLSEQNLGVDRHGRMRQSRRLLDVALGGDLGPLLTRAANLTAPTRAILGTARNLTGGAVLRRETGEPYIADGQTIPSGTNRFDPLVRWLTGLPLPQSVDVEDIVQREADRRQSNLQRLNR